MENRIDVIKSALKLSRAMRRRPPRGDRKFPPPVARTLSVLADNDGATSRELCEILDVRPSSLSELLGKMEEHGLVIRRTSDEDKRAAQVLLTDEGKAAAAGLKEDMEKHASEFSACFTDEEAEQFCSLAAKLIAHLEATAPEGEGGHCGHGRGHGACHGPERGFHGHHGPFPGPERGFHGHHGPFCRPF